MPNHGNLEKRKEKVQKIKGDSQQEKTFRNRTLLLSQSLHYKGCLGVGVILFVVKQLSNRSLADSIACTALAVTGTGNSTRPVVSFATVVVASNSCGRKAAHGSYWGNQRLG